MIILPNAHLWVDNQRVAAYTEGSFRQDIQNAIRFHFGEPSVLGAYIAAAKKRYKSHYAINLLLTKKDVDWIPTLANYVIKRCMGRSVSRLLLNERLGQSDRTAHAKSPDFDRIDEIVEELLPSFNSGIALLELEMTDIVEQQKRQARKSPSEKVKERSEAEQAKKTKEKKKKKPA